MKRMRLLLSILTMMSALVLHAQMIDPVHFTSELKTGKGEMKTATASGAAAEIAARLGLGPWATQALERFIALGPEEQRAFLETLEKLLGPANADQTSTIDEKVESYRAELEAQAASEKWSASQTGSEKEA